MSDVGVCECKRMSVCVSACECVGMCVGVNVMWVCGCVGVCVCATAGHCEVKF